MCKNHTKKPHSQTTRTESKGSRSESLVLNASWHWRPAAENTRHTCPGWMGCTEANRDQYPARGHFYTKFIRHAYLRLGPNGKTSTRSRNWLHHHIVGPPFFAHRPLHTRKEEMIQNVRRENLNIRCSRGLGSEAVLERRLRVEGAASAESIKTSSSRISVDSQRYTRRGANGVHPLIVL